MNFYSFYHIRRRLKRENGTDGGRRNICLLFWRKHLEISVKYDTIVRNNGKEVRRMIILGIDPGYAIVGYGLVEFQNNRFKVLDYGAITTDKDEDMSVRLKHIYSELQHLIDLYHPDAVAIEELFFNKNAKTAILVAQGRGTAIVACANKNVPLHEYTPLQIKQALVGYGRADKKQIQYMVRMILNLKEVPKPDDTADALAVAICHGNSYHASNIMDLKTGI